jgi:hypothetical protein
MDLAISHAQQETGGIYGIHGTLFSTQWYSNETAQSHIAEIYQLASFRTHSLGISSHQRQMFSLEITRRLRLWDRAVAFRFLLLKNSTTKADLQLTTVEIAPALVPSSSSESKFFGDTQSQQGAQHSSTLDHFNPA